MIGHYVWCCYDALEQYGYPDVIHLRWFLVAIFIV